MNFAWSFTLFSIPPERVLFCLTLVSLNFTNDLMELGSEYFSLYRVVTVKW